MPLRLLLFLGFVAAFVAGRPAAGADPPPGPLVGAVVLAGLSHVREDVCRRALTLRPGAAYSAEQMEADRRALMALGYFRSCSASQQSADGKAVVTYRVSEWPLVRHIRILGNTVLERRALFDVISTRVGQVLCAPQLQDDVRAIEELYQQRGYVARVSERLLDQAATTGILRFEILELQIDEVQVEGSTPVVRERARKVLDQYPPALYRPEAVTADRRRLMRVKGVENAIPVVEITSPGKVRIRWRLNPPPDTEMPSMPK